MTEFQRTTQQLQAEITALRSSLQEARQTFNIELDALHTQLNNQAHNNLPKATDNKPPHSSTKSKKQPKQTRSTTPSKDDSQKSTCAPTYPTPPPQPHLSDTENPPSLNFEPPVSRAPSPTHPIYKVTVAMETTTILLGDSTVKHIDLSRSLPPNSAPQKVCFDDLTVSGLTQWLTQQTRNPHVKQTTFHVGITDCCECSSTTQASGVPALQWSFLITECQRVFPRAQIRASSILPARGRSPLNSIIRTSNVSLQETCSALGVKYIDHSTTFTASSGAPKMALYSSSLLPSRKGTAHMAENLYPPKQSPPPRPIMNRHLSKRPPLLQTPPHHRAASVSFQQHAVRSANTPPPPLLNQSEYPNLPKRHQQSPFSSQSCPSSSSLPPPHHSSIGVHFPASTIPSVTAHHNPLPPSHHSSIGVHFPAPAIPSLTAHHNPLPPSHHSSLGAHFPAPAIPSVTAHHNLLPMNQQLASRGNEATQSVPVPDFASQPAQQSAPWPRMTSHESPTDAAYTAERDERRSGPWPYGAFYRQVMPPLPPPMYPPHFARSRVPPVWYNWPYFMPPPH